MVQFIYSAQHRDFFKRPDIFFQIIADRSIKFNDSVGTFPTTNNRIVEIAGNDHSIKKIIVEHAMDVSLLIDKDVQLLIAHFLEYKKNNGTKIEKALYKDMSLQQFIVRLLIKRPLMFMTEADQYLLRDGKTRGSGGFEAIGKDFERAPLVLKDYLSYDEMAIAALIGISVPTYFINNGARDNRGDKGVDGTFEKEGVYAGLVGARFEKPGYMEWQHMIITPQQNTRKNGYGFTVVHKGLLALWSGLYGEKIPTFDEARADNSGRFILLKNGLYFDSVVYKKRIRFVAEPFLIDAHNRAAMLNKKAYVHVVGLGLGVWQIDERQVQYMLNAYTEIIGNNDLSSISDIDFSWFNGMSQQDQDAIIQVGKEKGITIIFSKRNPADRLVDANAGKLLVACYAWDGNAYPGNEYWAGMLTASGDPAAACCSTIAELQNPSINFYIEQYVKEMNGEVRNLRPGVKSIKINSVSVHAKSQWEKIKSSIQNWWKTFWRKG